jgi:hypothetical protein
VFKKVNFSSPIGIALMAAGVILALSPDARRAIRKLMVKGTAGVMDIAEQVGGVTAGLAKQPTATWKSNTQLEQPMEQPVTQTAVLQPAHHEVVPSTNHVTDNGTDHATENAGDTDGLKE